MRKYFSLDFNFLIYLFCACCYFRSYLKPLTQRLEWLLLWLNIWYQAVFADDFFSIAVLRRYSARGSDRSRGRNRMRANKKIGIDTNRLIDLHTKNMSWERSYSNTKILNRFLLLFFIPPRAINCSTALTFFSWTTKIFISITKNNELELWIGCE